MRQATTPLIRHITLAILVAVLLPPLTHAATLATDTPLFLKPSPDAPSVAVLPAGSTVEALPRDTLAAEGIDPLPSGWIAVRYSGPVHGYALNSAVGKDFTLKPGAIIRAGPAADAPVFSIVAEGDTVEAVELVGDWSRVSFEKSTILFLDIGDTLPAEASPAPEQAPAVTTAENTGATEAAATEAAPIPALAAPPPPDIQAAAPRVFQGYLARTRRILGAGPKLDYQLLDENNRRIALLDLSALLITEPIDRFEGMRVSVFGPLLRREGVKDLIIRVETIRLLN